MTIVILHAATRVRGLFAPVVGGLLLLALAIIPAGVGAQGRPDIRWIDAGHGGAITDVAQSPDGTLLATSSDDRTVKLWRYPEGDLVRTLVLPYSDSDQVMGIARVRFTADGGHVVAAVNHVDGVERVKYSGAVHVFRVSDGAPERELARQGESISAIALSPDGASLATAGEVLGVSIWRFADGKLLKTLDQQPGGAIDVDFSPTGDRLCAGYDNGHVVAWKTGKWALLWDVQVDGSEGLTRTLFSPDGAVVATADFDGTALLLAASNGTLLHTLATGSAIRAARFSPDGQELATAGFDGRIRLWDVAQGTLVRRFADSGGTIASLAFVDDGRALISGGEYPSTRIKAWNPADGTLTRTLTHLANRVNRVVVSGDSELLAVAVPFDERIDILRAKNGRRLYSWNTHARAEDAAFSPMRDIVATPGADNTVVIRRLSDGKAVRTLTGHEDYVTGLAFSHDGSLLASGSFFPGSIRLWRSSDWSLVRVLQGGPDLGFGPFVSFTFSPDDTLLGTVAEASPLVVRVSDGSVVARPAGTSFNAKFSPDGRLFVVSGGAGSSDVAVYRVSDWKLTATLKPAAADVAFTPDGRHLLAAQRDGLRFWRTSDWSTVKTYDQELGYTGSIQGVQSVTIFPDGVQMAYGRDDATVVVARNPGSR
jgi:WD40 repeat protein